MKSTWLLLVGIAIGALGSGTYVANSNKDRPEIPSVDPGDQVVASNQERPRSKSLWPAWNPNKGTKSKTVGEKTARTATTEPTKTPRKEIYSEETRPVVSNLPRPIGGTDQPSQEELAELAGRIEKRASRELDRLTRLLDLTEQQQDQIFPLLARSSTAYHPALAIQVGEAETSNISNLPSEGDDEDADSSNASKPSTGGNSGAEDSTPLLAKEADEEIHHVLTEEQKQALEDAVVDEDLWWSDIVDDLEDELDESVEVAPDEDTGYQGNTGIGNLLQQSLGE
ncbi:MAG: Spy/CpxP family protein refolding chaperone [Verrucomicrobiales bacterium]|jgi:Spy/CpxP family protein refolding chaperone